MATMMAKTAPKSSPTKSPAPKKSGGSSKCSATKCTTSQTTRTTEFTLHAPHASEVILVGDFNNWDGTKYRMTKAKNGVCKKAVKLPPGRYEYRFIVDGEWWTDPNNADRQINAYGSENSVITVC